MKILKMLGIVVAVHVVALVLVYLPACQSSSSRTYTSHANNTPAPTTGMSRIEAARAQTPLAQPGQPAIATNSYAYTAAPVNTTNATAQTTNQTTNQTSGVIYSYPNSSENFSAPTVGLPQTYTPPGANTNSTSYTTTMFSAPSTTVVAADNAPALPSQATTVTTYTVVPNDSPWKIAHKYGITTSALLAANNLPADPKLQIGQKLAIPSKTATPAATASIPGTFIYKVKPNDSLNNIAARYNTSADRIKTLNKLTTAAIRVDQELFIPTSDNTAMPNDRTAVYGSGPAPAASTTAVATTPGVTATHVVKPGEMLSTIAQYYGASANEIGVVNHISDPKKLRVGATLTIPNARKNTASATLASSTTATTTPATNTRTPAPTANTPAPTQNSKPAPFSPVTPANNSPISPVTPANTSPMTPAPFSPAPTTTLTGSVTPYTPPVSTVDDTTPFGAP